MSEPIIPGTETCGCCEGLASATPTGIANRIGLSSIAYRIGAYPQFRQSMIAGLSSSAYSQLGNLRTRDADDYTLALIDAAACAADVLTFYQERLANESYLPTATERVSLQEMAKLIGYRLRPGVAAETRLAFALEPPRTPPAGLSPDPGAFVTGIPTSLTLAQGLQVQSIPGPDEKPQTFETVEAIEARPEWNAIRPRLSESRSPGFGATDTWIEGVANNLRPGDGIVFVGAEFAAAPTTNNNWDFRLIESVELDTDNGRTHVTWARPLGSVSPHSNPSVAPAVHVLRKRAAVFGNNAPMWLAMNADFRKDYPDGSTDLDEWPNFTISAKAASGSGGYVDLDSVLSEVKPGGYAVLAKGEYNRPDESFPPGTYVELYNVTSTTEVSRAEFALSGKVSRLGLQGQNLDDRFFEHPRRTSVYAQSEALALAQYPLTDAIEGDAIPIDIDGANLEGRAVIVKGVAADGGATIAHDALIVSVAADANGAVLTISPQLPSALVRDSVVIHANVALATHGETATQILGSGDASVPFQRFELTRLPLTYRSAANETGADSELTVRVGDVEWSEQDTLYGAESNERVYTLVTDEQAKLWVAFGDGVRGARLPSGVNNIRATYRTGLGVAGNVGADKLTQLMTRPLGLKSVSNPAAAAGGTDPESADDARRTMPLGTRTLGRAVSLLDYEDFAHAYTGIGKARAEVLQLAGGRTIVVTIAGADGSELSASSPVLNNLWAALKASGDPHVAVQLVSYTASTFRVGLKVKRDPAYEIGALLDAVEAALRDAFSFASRSLGQPVLQSEVIAAAHSVPGVVAVDLDFLYGGTSPAAQTVQSLQTRVLASRMHVSGGIAVAAELLTLDPAPFDRLEEMT
jgi:hypothetical protein